MRRLLSSAFYSRNISGQPVVARPGNFVDFMPDINTFLQEHLFADIFSRGVLSYREIATIAALSGMGNVNPQLRSHINAGLNVGLNAQQIRDIFSVIANNIDGERGNKGLQLLDDVMTERPR